MRSEDEQRVERSWTWSTSISVVFAAQMKHSRSVFNLVIWSFVKRWRSKKRMKWFCLTLTECFTTVSPSSDKTLTLREMNIVHEQQDSRHSSVDQGVVFTSPKSSSEKLHEGGKMPSFSFHLPTYLADPDLEWRTLLVIFAPLRLGNV